MPCKYSIPVQHQARRNSSCVSCPRAVESPLFVRGLHPSFVRARSPRCWGLCGARLSRSGRTSPLGDGGVSAGVCASHRVCPTASLSGQAYKQATGSPVFACDLFGLESACPPFVLGREPGRPHCLCRQGPPQTQTTAGLTREQLARQAASLCDLWQTLSLSLFPSQTLHVL